jgi:hypothetical protein
MTTTEKDVSAAAATPSTPHLSATSQALEAETVLDAYSIVAEWIRFADAKAAVTLTVNGVLMGLLIPAMKAYLADTTTVHPTTWWLQLVGGFFVAWLLLLLASVWCSFLCILPFRGKGRQLALDHATHFHPAAIAQKFAVGQYDEFVADYERIGMTGLRREALTTILLDAHLSNAKYRYVANSIRCLAWSVIFGVLFLLSTLF